MPFNFDDKCLEAFQVLKEKLVSTPFIIVLDWSKSFKLMGNANNFSIGAIMVVKRQTTHAFYYASKTLDDAQMKHATTKKNFKHLPLLSKM